MKLSIGRGEFLLGDCLERMSEIPDGSVDMILCDLPYGTTQNKWDAVIPFAPLWEQYWRVAKPNAAIVLTAAQPFTSALVMSQTDAFKYDWAWKKTIATGQLNAKKQPLRNKEDVLVFYRKQPIYNPQGLMEGKTSGGKLSKSTNYGAMSGINEQENTGYPKTVLEFSNPNNANIHPTQKPVALFEYLIRTYTDEGQTVLDNCAGSGTTAIAAEASGRRWICIERDPGYYCAAVARVTGVVNA